MSKKRRRGYNLNRFAQEMRVNPTSGELVMLGRLEMSGLKFKHQQPAGCYIVDFMVPSKLVIIEVDGKYHEDAEQQTKDARRQHYLETMGFHFFRVKNGESALFDFEQIRSLPDASPSDLGKAMGKSGSWGKAKRGAHRRRIMERLARDC